MSATSIECRAGLDVMTLRLWLVTALVLRLVGFDNPCRLGTEMVSLVGVIRLVHILLPVPYTHRVARVCYIHALRRLTTILDFMISVDSNMVGYRRCSCCQPEPTSTSSSLLLQEPSWPSVPGGRRASGTARAVLHACPCSFWNWRLVYYSTS